MSKIDNNISVHATQLDNETLHWERHTVIYITEDFSQTTSKKTGVIFFRWSFMA